ncbi:MAG: FecR domain-containing protein [Woeseiaceae bacterium]|nr:FecR domain-containing protein [Woeseiaceae bacterium]
MSEKTGAKTARQGDAVEALLRQASPRPVPPAADRERVRAAVRAEWLDKTRRRRRRRRVRAFALAASVLVAVLAAIVMQSPAPPPPVQVATVDRSHGAVYLLGERSELRALPASNVIVAGQSVMTGDDAGLGLAWQTGGSLRLGENTRMEFRAADTVLLRSGRVYFDSEASLLAANAAGGPAPRVLRIETPHGSVEHVGTQFMTVSDEDGLTVSVREGEVVVETPYYEQTAAAGEQLRVSGSARPSVVDIRGYGPAWDWVEATAPAAALDGRTVREFLGWVARETGLGLEFEDAAAETLAMTETLRGTVNTGPREALRVWMLGVDLEWRIENGVIRVRATGRGH